MPMIDTLPPDNGIRAEIEQRIIASAKLISQEADQDCYDFTSLRALQESWLALRDYYEKHEDFTISIEVVRDFRNSTDLLAASWKDAVKSDACRDQVYEALDEVESHLDGIITVVNRRLYPDGW